MTPPDRTPATPATPDEVIAHEWRRFLDLLAAAGPAALDAPTRLAGWTVRDLARHAHWGVTFEADGLARALDARGGHATGRPYDGPDDGLVPALEAARADLTSALGALAALGHDGDAVTVPMPYGDLPLPLARHVFAMEATVHRSDLGHALRAVVGDDADPSLNPAGVPSVAVFLDTFWAAIAAAGTPPAAGAGVRLEGTSVLLERAFDGAAWGPLDGDPTVTVRGSDEAVLLLALGRARLDELDVVVEGDAALAARLKEHVPGP